MTDIVERLREAMIEAEMGRLRRELDEARALAKQWRDVYEWDAIEDPLPIFNFPWEEKPCL